MTDEEQMPGAQPETRGTRGVERVTIPALKLRKQTGPKIVMVTAYDCVAARLADRAGVDVVLVGDSLGQTVLGYDTTVPVTLEEMLHHTRAVRRGLRRALLLADMPFGSYQVSPEEAIHNAVRLLKEGGAQAVKIEGGQPFVETVRRMTEASIPVMGHLGLTPQSVHMLGGHRVQGQDPEAARRILADARALEEAGAIGIVLETIPAALAAEVTAALSIPTIGIGAGPDCDGQVQVWHDLIGLSQRTFRHARRYAEVGTQIENALRAYVEEVRQMQFPTREHSL
ncbi:MAG: 3-methyl-2-oxobutanoate hydroxymethyltransferase [Chloroherpetonaceae bacterium]|nr:3-methyl-2-oxobutanoate hydroxymethyltransferase [Chthonomonadaceae bacterium]MDW8208664.1 3-methyl-2-oxobutanoate hydroxymethyltransferase [Chloroherpetonaceae bacterium]